MNIRRPPRKGEIILQDGVRTLVADARAPAERHRWFGSWLVEFDNGGGAVGPWSRVFTSDSDPGGLR